MNFLLFPKPTKNSVHEQKNLMWMEALGKIGMVEQSKEWNFNHPAQTGVLYHSHMTFCNKEKYQENYIFIILIRSNKKHKIVFFSHVSCVCHNHKKLVCD